MFVCLFVCFLLMLLLLKQQVSSGSSADVYLLTDNTLIYIDNRGLTTTLELRALLFSNSVVGSFTSPSNSHVG